MAALLDCIQLLDNAERLDIGEGCQVDEGSRQMEGVFYGQGDGLFRGTAVPQEALPPFTGGHLKVLPAPGVDLRIPLGKACILGDVEEQSQGVECFGVWPPNFHIAMGICVEVAVHGAI